MTAFFYQQIITSHNVDILQLDLYSLEQWANKWLIKFNPLKCIVSKVTNKICPNNFQYSLYDQRFKHVSEAKYLGLTLDTKLNFNKHIDNMICKKQKPH